MAKILIAQYHSEVRGLMTLLLRQQGYEVTATTDLDEIKHRARRREIDLLILDIMTPGVDIDIPTAAFRQTTGERAHSFPILLTDVNGLLETLDPGSLRGADGLFAPRTGRSESFLKEVTRLLSPPGQRPHVHSWRLDKQELPSFLFACFLFGISGYLTLRDQRVHKSLHFVDGWIRSASSSLENDWLGKMLLARHMVTPEALNEVERALSSSQRKIGEEFIARGYLTEHKLQEALNQQYASIVMSVFEWGQTEITLDEGSPNPAPHLVIHPFRLVLSGLNVGFTGEEIDQLLPDLSFFLSPTVWTAFRFTDVKLSPEEKQLLLLIDGQRDIEMLIAESPFTPEATKIFLLTLFIMRAVISSPQPESIPITFSRQIESDNMALIEDEFFSAEDEVMTFDDLNHFASDEIDPTKKLTWRERFELLEHLAAARYLVAVIAILLGFGIIFAVLLSRDMTLEYGRRQHEMETTRTEMVFIRKPHFEKAEKLLTEALIILQAERWRGLDEVRSLIGASLDIDPEYNEAINFRTSLELTINANELLRQQNYQTAYHILGQAVTLFPENLLADELMEKIPNSIKLNAPQAP